MSEHTPGPWKATDAKVYGADGEPVARAWHDKDALEREANAHLIAAAPELLEALEAFVDACDKAPPMELLAYIDAACAKARAALKLAKP